ncbi:DUF6504 family protein [Sphingomonas sp. MMS12-HWE2-04]|uniref:DUF6504 family protein n=1 Tax=Sphingomonas sp. MMS12-HWE2-04 TaxID=3234199 RepID=UPI00384FC925
MADPALLESLRAQLRALEPSGFKRRPALPFGIAAVNSRLSDGGLRLDALHEIAGGSADMADDCAATLFLAGIAARAWGPVLWVVRRRDLFAPGLSQSGLDPQRLIYAEAGDDAELLAIMEEGLRHRGLGAVIGEARRADMAATRRIQLAAEGGRTIALLMRRHAREGADPLRPPSAAVTRWRIGCAPSAPLPVAGVGRPRWRVELARQKGENRSTRYWRPAMQRVAALYLPHWPIERLWRAGRRTTRPPEPRPAASLAPLRQAVAGEQQHACSVPRGGGWRPGARWAREDQPGQVALPPVTRARARHEVGRKDEAATNPFRAMPPDEGGHSQFLDERAREAEPPEAMAGQGSPAGKVGAPPLVTAVHIGSRVEIAAACPAALALGLRPGMAITQARAQLPGLDIRPADPEGDRASLRSLAILAARRWSPIVALSGEDGLFLDLTGTAHLFGGEESMAWHIVRLLARAGFTAQVAIADTPGAAWALARLARTRVTPCPRGDQARALADLPPSALRIDDAASELLKRLGIDRIGQLAALPRAPLVRRFGAATVLRLDQALGRIPEPLDPVVPPHAIAVRQRFAEPILTADAIEHWLGVLVLRLAAALEAEGLGVRALECIAERIDGVPQRIRIGLARPSRDPAHLLRLLCRRIEDVEPGYGIDAVTLHVRRAGPLGPEPLVERLDEEAAPDLATLVDTLATRIGLAAMWRMRPVESDVPERAAARAPVLDPPMRAAQAGKRDDIRQLARSPALHPWHPQWPKPARLLRRPERLDHVIAELPDHAPRRFTWRGLAHKVVHADGPERIHGEWWKRDAERSSVRDYFRVEDEAGRRYWLFRSGDGEHAVTGDLSWYLHGVFG